MIPALTFMSGASMAAFILMEGYWKFGALVLSAAAAVAAIGLASNGIA